MIQSIIQSDSSPKNFGARYYIAQHMPNVMRKEPRNIGILVQKGNIRVTKFLGQDSSDGKIDARSLRSIADTRVYKMWLRHWEKSLTSDDWETKILKQSKPTYQFIPGGEVTDSGSDSAEDIANYLFSMLVSGGGLSEALGGEVEDMDIAAIKSSIKSEFKRLKIMKSVADSDIKHPIFEDRDLQGTSEWHRVTFLQESQQESWVFEPLDLNARLKQHARERAGYLAYLFGDLRKMSAKKMNTHAILRVSDDAKDEKHVKYAINAVRNNADITDWNDDKQRKELLNQCESAARAA